MQLQIDPKTYIDEYNRKTTDYGNGQIEIVTYHYPKCKCINTRDKWSKQKAVISDDAQEKRTRSQVYAIRRRVKGYALSNDFKWFATLTYNPQQIDSLNYDIAKNTLLKWCRWMRDKYQKFDYLLIPELHKSGAVHFHGLLGDIPANFIDAKHPKTEQPIIRNGRTVYNLVDWKYGFSDCEKIENPEKASLYIKKYVTTALLTDKNMYHKKRYFNSQGLQKPKITFEMADNSELNEITPNFGLIAKDIHGNNFVDVGLYKMAKNQETGKLEQRSDDYLLIAKK